MTITAQLSLLSVDNKFSEDTMASDNNIRPVTGNTACDQSISCCDKPITYESIDYYDDVSGICSAPYTPDYSFNLFEKKSPSHSKDSVWFSGTVEDAFAKAKQENKIVFLAWGATWCPPCGMLEQQVFSQTRFAELTKLVIPLYLDGDTDPAQKWGDELGVKGYPTMLLLDADKKELWRLSDFVTINEFEMMFTTALSTKKSLPEILRAAVNGTATDENWRLIAWLSWSNGVKLTGLNKINEITFQKTLFEMVPKHLLAERSLVAAQFLYSVAKISADNDIKDKTGLVEARKITVAALNAMLTDDTAIMAARAAIAYSFTDMIRFAFPDLKTNAAQHFIKKWLDAVDKIQQNTSLPGNIRLASYYAKIEAVSIIDPKTSIPQELKDEIRTTVKTICQSSANSHERVALISTASRILMAIDNHNLARELLSGELESTDMPWYYQFLLAYLEERLGRKSESIMWSKKVRLSSRGNASCIKWIVSDVLRNVRLGSSINEIIPIVREFYEASFSAPNGFIGRNLDAAIRLAKDIGKLPPNKSLDELINHYRKICDEKMADPGLSGCQSHFEAFDTSRSNTVINESK